MPEEKNNFSLKTIREARAAMESIRELNRAVENLATSNAKFRTSQEKIKRIFGETSEILKEMEKRQENFQKKQINFLWKRLRTAKLIGKTEIEYVWSTSKAQERLERKWLIINDLQERMNEALERHRKLTERISGSWGRIKRRMEELTGIDFEKLLGISAIIAGINAYAELEHKVSMTRRQMREFAGDRGLQASVEALTRMASYSRLSADEFIEMASKAAIARLDIFRQVEGSRKTIGELIADYKRLLGVSADIPISLGRELVGFFGKSTGQAEKFLGFMIKNIDKYRDRLGLAAQDIEAMFANLQGALPNLAKLLGKSFSPEVLKKFAAEANKMTAVFARVGIEASRVGEIIRNITDIDRLEENMFALTQFGITLEDLFNRQDVVLRKVLMNLPRIAKQLAGMNAFQRLALLRAYKGIIPEDMWAKLMTGDFEAAIRQANEVLSKGEDSLVKLRKEAADDLGQLRKELQNLVQNLLVAIKPLIGPLTWFVRQLNHVFANVIIPFFNSGIGRWIVNILGGGALVLLAGKFIKSIFLWGKSLKNIRNFFLGKGLPGNVCSLCGGNIANSINESLSKGGFFKNLKNLVTKQFPSAFKAAGRFLKLPLVRGIGGAGLLAWGAADIYKNVRETGHILGKKGDYLGALGTGAKIGAGIGMLFGPVGALIGAGIGAAAGGIWQAIRSSGERSAKAAERSVEESRRINQGLKELTIKTYKTNKETGEVFLGGVKKLTLQTKKSMEKVKEDALEKERKDLIEQRQNIKITQEIKTELEKLNGVNIKQKDLLEENNEIQITKSERYAIELLRQQAKPMTSEWAEIMAEIEGGTLKTFKVGV